MRARLVRVGGGALAQATDDGPWTNVMDKRSIWLALGTAGLAQWGSSTTLARLHHQIASSRGWIYPIHHYYPKSPLLHFSIVAAEDDVQLEHDFCVT